MVCKVEVAIAVAVVYEEAPFASQTATRIPVLVEKALRPDDDLILVVGGGVHARRNILPVQNYGAFRRGTSAWNRDTLCGTYHCYQCCQNHARQQSLEGHPSGYQLSGVKAPDFRHGDEALSRPRY